MLQLDDAIKRYNLTPAQAVEVPIKFGLNKGKVCGDLDPSQLMHYAKIKTKTSYTPDFRAVVRASRVLASMHLLGKSRDAEVKKFNAMRDTATHCLAECNSCSRRNRISTSIFDRRARPKCYSCGGTIVRVSASVESEWIDLREASRITRRNRETLRRLAKAGTIASDMRGGKWYVVRDEVLNHTYSPTGESDERNHRGTP